MHRNTCTATPFGQRFSLRHKQRLPQPHTLRTTPRKRFDGKADQEHRAFRKTASHVLTDT